MIRSEGLGGPRGASHQVVGMQAQGHRDERVRTCSVDKRSINSMQCICLHSMGSLAFPLHSLINQLRGRIVHWQRLPLRFILHANPRHTYGILSR